MFIPCRVGNYKCKYVWAVNASPPQPAVLLPLQLECYYPPSLSTTLCQLEYTPPDIVNSFLDSSWSWLHARAVVSYRLIGLGLVLLHHSKWVPPPQILRLSTRRGVSREWWSQNSKPAFTCNLPSTCCCLFDSISSRPSCYGVYWRSHYSKIIYYLFK